MSEYDLVIRGGTIVDGTGIPRYKADVAVKDGRVARISGKMSAGGAKEIDASGCIVAPGAVDLHTHYDGQLNWDPYCSLSGWFGVTSLTIGQCGFGFAPTKPEDRDLNMRMMNRIEAIPLESMRLGMRWDWETFPEYLDSLDRQGLGVNVGALIPYSPIRGYVMGMMEARQRTHMTDAELSQMKQIVHEGMVAGGFGISADKDLVDRPEDGSFLPTHVADDSEFLAQAEILSQFGVGHMGWTLGTDDRDGQQRLLAEMTRVSGRPLHVAIPADDDESLNWISEMQATGLPILAQIVSMEIEQQFQLSEFNLFDILPNWIQPLVGSPEERAAKLRAPGIRDAMRQDLFEDTGMQRDISIVRVVQVVHERNYKYEGRFMGEIAREEGKEPLDSFLDLALDEGLLTEFAALFTDPGDEALGNAILNPFSHVSLSDGGAHTRYNATSIWPVHILANWVRDKELMTLEQAHYKISALPAWFASFNDRGTLRVGNWADIIVYNQSELGYVYDKPVYSNDFPGGERRLIQKPTGLRYTMVNGTVTFEGNECTGALPGKLLRSYDMVD